MWEAYWELDQYAARCWHQNHKLQSGAESTVQPLIEAARVTVRVFVCSAEGDPCRQPRCAQPVPSRARPHPVRVPGAAARRREPAPAAARRCSGLRGAAHGALRDGHEHPRPCSGPGRASGPGSSPGSSGRSCSTTFRSLPAFLPARPGELSPCLENPLPWKGN